MLGKDADLVPNFPVEFDSDFENELFDGENVLDFYDPDIEKKPGAPGEKPRRVSHSYLNHVIFRHDARIVGLEKLSAEFYDLKVPEKLN
jgi:hypothetical protein